MTKINIYNYRMFLKNHEFHELAGAVRITGDSIRVIRINLTPMRSLNSCNSCNSWLKTT